MNQESETGVNILVVDDQDANLDALDNTLDSLGVNLMRARSGKEALKLLLDVEFALILMDVNMPVMGGLETAALIRSGKKFGTMPIIFMSACDHESSLVKEGYAIGAVDFIFKPYEPHVLRSKVKVFVDLFRAHSQNALRMQSILNSVADGVLGIDQNGHITFANPNACGLLEIEHSELMNHSIQDFLCSVLKVEDQVENPMVTHLSHDDIIQRLQREDNFSFGNERWVTVSGRAFFVEYSCEAIRNSEGKKDGAVVTFQNVSERKATEAKLIRLANYDPLTSLANRAYFHDSLVRGIARSIRNQNELVLLLIDLDHFKNVNDTLGHNAGDALLKVVGRRISESIRAGDIAARIGGDEFAVILHDVDSVVDIASIADKISMTVRDPIQVSGNSISISASIGIAMYEVGMSLTELVKAADMAMYAAKAEGRNNFQFFETEMQIRTAERNRIQTTLLHAVKNNEISVHYQPKVSIGQDKVVGLEALVRWTTSDGIKISPDLFIPIAEDSGQIHELGEFVFHEVCKQIEQWNSLPGFEEIVVSVNVSALQLKTENFHKLIESALTTYNIDPRHLELELTETAVMSDPALAAKELQLIHDLGVKISIDDFGTGYSSLSYLKRFPIDVLKIDQSIVSDIGNDNLDEDIIRIVVAIAHTMGIHVIAEGVETKEQLGFLSSVGCDLVQGWFFSKAADASATTEMINHIDTTYNACFQEFHAYMSDNNIVSMQGKSLH